MDSSRDVELEARLAKIESAIAAMQRSLDVLLADRPRRFVDRPSLSKGPSASQRRENLADEIGENLSAWFASRSPEWWLSRLGIGFVILSVLLLYGYAIDKGWITPPVRVLAGILLGTGLFWTATRTPSTPASAKSHEPGMRELFFGGALAVWYVSAYAAAVWYQLISIPTARLAFFALALLSTWIALQERREIFALLAVLTGFATPFILTAPLGSMTQLSLYLGVVTAMGLTIYLMRGWHPIIWITFVAFWLSVAAVANSAARLNPARGSFAITVLLVLATAAFARLPSLRRELLLLGSGRYTPLPVTPGLERWMEALDSLAAALGGGKSAPDSAVVWVLPIVSPILAVDFLEPVWPTAPSEIWGLALLLLGSAAFVLARRASQRDPGIRHVEVTAAALWAVLGTAKIVFAPENIPLASFVATLVMLSTVRKFPGARTVAKGTIAIALAAFIGHELGLAEVGLLHLRWVLSGIATIGCAALIAQVLISDRTEKMQGLILAVAAYLTGLVLLWRMLEPVWPPLVTTSYAVVGAALLIMSGRPRINPLVRHLGGVTMLVVVARLLLIDLSSVGTIWRVLLFLVCGAVFLYTGYRIQPRPARKSAS